MSWSDEDTSAFLDKLKERISLPQVQTSLQRLEKYGKISERARKSIIRKESRSVLDNMGLSASETQEAAVRHNIGNFSDSMYIIRTCEQIEDLCSLPPGSYFSGHAFTNMGQRQQGSKGQHKMNERPELCDPTEQTAVRPDVCKTENADIDMTASCQSLHTSTATNSAALLQAVSVIPGDTVILDGLSKSPQFNGCQGVVEKLDLRRGCIVALESGERVHLKTSNLIKTQMNALPQQESHGIEVAQRISGSINKQRDASNLSGLCSPPSPHEDQHQKRQQEDEQKQVKEEEPEHMQEHKQEQELGQEHELEKQLAHECKLNLDQLPVQQPLVSHDEFEPCEQPEHPRRMHGQQQDWHALNQKQGPFTEQAQNNNVCKKIELRTHGRRCGQIRPGKLPRHIVTQVPIGFGTHVETQEYNRWTIHKGGVLFRGGANLTGVRRQVPLDLFLCFADMEAFDQFGVQSGGSASSTQTMSRASVPTARKGEGARADSPQATPCAFQVNDKVRISGIKTRPELNHQEATLVNILESKSSAQLRLACGSLVRVKFKNICKCDRTTTPLETKIDLSINGTGAHGEAQTGAETNGQRTGTANAKSTNIHTEILPQLITSNLSHDGIRWSRSVSQDPKHLINGTTAQVHEEPEAEQVDTASIFIKEAATHVGKSCVSRPTSVDSSKEAGTQKEENFVLGPSSAAPHLAEHAVIHQGVQSNSMQRTPIELHPVPNSTGALPQTAIAEENTGPKWLAIGVGDGSGIVVRERVELASRKASAKLQKGAVLQEIELIGERLHFCKISGDGPSTGWISLTARGQRNVEAMESGQGGDTSAPEPTLPATDTTFAHRLAALEANRQRHKDTLAKMAGEEASEQDIPSACVATTHPADDGPSKPQVFHQPLGQSPQKIEHFRLDSDSENEQSAMSSSCRGVPASAKKAVASKSSMEEPKAPRGAEPLLAETPQVPLAHNLAEPGRQNGIPALGDKMSPDPELNEASSGNTMRRSPRNQETKETSSDWSRQVSDTAGSARERGQSLQAVNKQGERSELEAKLERQRRKIENFEEACVASGDGKFNELHIEGENEQDDVNSGCISQLLQGDDGSTAESAITSPAPLCHTEVDKIAVEAMLDDKLAAFESKLQFTMDRWMDTLNTKLSSGLDKEQRARQMLHERITQRVSEVKSSLETKTLQSEKTLLELIENIQGPVPHQGHTMVLSQLCTPAPSHQENMDDLRDQVLLQTRLCEAAFQKLEGLQKWKEKHDETMTTWRMELDESIKSLQTDTASCDKQLKHLKTHSKYGGDGIRDLHDKPVIDVCRAQSPNEGSLCNSDSPIVLKMEASIETLHSESRECLARCEEMEAIIETCMDKIDELHTPTRDEMPDCAEIQQCITNVEGRLNHIEDLVLHQQLIANVEGRLNHIEDLVQHQADCLNRVPVVKTVGRLCNENPFSSESPPPLNSAGRSKLPWHK